jgi:hypothetical protein
MEMNIYTAIPVGIAIGSLIVWFFTSDKIIK